MIHRFTVLLYILVALFVSKFRTILDNAVTIVLSVYAAAPFLNFTAKPQPVKHQIHRILGHLRKSVKKTHGYLPYDSFLVRGVREKCKI